VFLHLPEEVIRRWTLLAGSGGPKSAVSGINYKNRYQHFSLLNGIISIP